MNFSALIMFSYSFNIRVFKRNRSVEGWVRVEIILIILRTNSNLSCHQLLILNKYFLYFFVELKSHFVTNALRNKFKFRFIGEISTHRKKEKK